VHLQVLEQMSHNSQNVRALATSVAAAPLPSFVAHDDVQETSELMDSAREMSPLLIQLNKAQTDVSTNSFGCELQYVATELPERRTASPVLDLVSVEEHVDVHPHVAEQTLQDSPNVRVLENSLAIVPVSSSVAHDDVQVNVVLPHSASNRELDPLLLQHIESQENSIQHSQLAAGNVSSSVAAVLATIDPVHTSVCHDLLADGDVDSTAGPASNILSTQNAVQHHSNPNIQHDLESWNRIKEYDKRAAKVPFTPVLSKKQKQKLRQEVLGKPPYRTRSTGAASLTHQWLCSIGMHVLFNLIVLYKKIDHYSIKDHG
jgi:hypothetical protein